MCKNGNAFLYGFLILWGTLFAGIPLFSLLTMPNETRSNSFLFIMIFVVIGFAALTAGIVGVIKLIRAGAVLKKGKKTIGHFVCERGIGSMNGVPYYKITFNYTDDNGRYHEVLSAQAFTAAEMQRYKNSKGFTIKYIDERAAIDVDGEVFIEGEKILTTCEYCGTIFDGDKCPNCGAANKLK